MGNLVAWLYFLMVIASPWLFRYVASRPKTLKLSLAFGSLLISFWIIAAVLLAPYFEGKPRCSTASYEISASAELIRQFVILPGSYLALWLPILAIVLVASLPFSGIKTIGTKAAILIFIVSATLALIGIVFSVAIKCHYLGGCNFSSAPGC